MAQQDVSRTSRVYWLAFVVYWGVFLFGYDIGVAGGVVSQDYFKSHFGITDASGNADKKKADEINSNVVSVLQAGAIFGALGSAPLSAAIGRRWSLLTWISIFSVGAILQTVAGDSRGLGYIYSGRVISGIGIGAISAVAPAFVSECSPKQVRGRTTGLFQVTIATGVMLSYFINLGISIHIKSGYGVWRIPFGFQLVPAGLMMLGLFTIKESPRWLASKGRLDEAVANLSYLRHLPPTAYQVREEMAEIEAAIAEEREARKGLGAKEAFLGKGQLIRFVIAIAIFVLQQWSGQNSIIYYAPQIFASIGYTGTTISLLASGIFGVMKVIATTIFVFFLFDTFGRKRSLFVSAFGMGSMFIIVGALLKVYPPPTNASSPPPASKAMAAMLYLNGFFFAMGWGAIPWVYVSDIFPTRTRHYGIATGSATQWLFNFIISKVTPTLQSQLGYKLFFVFGSINLGAMTVFSLLIPETKGRSLEEMDVIFGAVTEEKRRADIAARERNLQQEKHSSEVADTKEEV